MWTEKLIATVIILFGAAALTFARRWNNEDTEAGYGVAGWAMFVIIMMWLD